MYSSSSSSLLCKNLWPELMIAVHLRATWINAKFGFWAPDPFVILVPGLWVMNDKISPLCVVGSDSALSPYPDWWLSYVGAMLLGPCIMFIMQSFFPKYAHRKDFTYAYFYGIVIYKTYSLSIYYEFVHYRHSIGRHKKQRGISRGK